MPSLDNPFQKNPFGNTNVSLVDTSKPIFGNTKTVNIGDSTSVSTKNPLLIDTPKIKLQKNQAQKDFESRMKLNERINKESKENNKKTKIPTWAWVVGGVAVLSVIGLIIYKTKK